MELDRLEATLGHRFADRSVLSRALTHASRSRDNYERLEFLGDRVLGLVVAEWLCEIRPDAEEGELAKSLAALVSRESLTQVARAIGLGSALKFSSGDAVQRSNPAILADACEAVIAALYLDAGLVVARSFIRAHWQGLLQQEPETGDAKTRLQEWTQARGLGLPVYELAERSGPDHAPTFTVEVTVKGHGPQRGAGPSKRIAERLAAEAMRKSLEELE